MDSYECTFKSFLSMMSVDPHFDINSILDQPQADQSENGPKSMGDVNAFKSQNKTLLIQAAQTKDCEGVIRNLVELRKDPSCTPPDLNITDSDGNTALWYAIANNFQKEASILLLAGANPNIGNCALHIAV